MHRSHLALALVVLVNLACGSDGAPGESAGDATEVAMGSAVAGGALAPMAPVGAQDMGTSDLVPGTALPVDSTGLVFFDPDMDQAAEIQGPWYGYDDCASSPGDCATLEFPPEGSFPNQQGSLCTRGTTAAINAADEFVTKVGAGIGLDLNRAAVDGAVAATFDARASGVVGFAFRLTAVPTVDGSPSSDGVRVAYVLPTTRQNPHFLTLMEPGVYEVRWADVMQTSLVSTTTRFDETVLEAVQFQVPSVFGAEVSFDFCIEAFSVLTD